MTPTAISQSILDTILTHLALLFLAAAANPAAAREAAAQILAADKAQTEKELRLASEIISFSFHALEALAEAAAPKLSQNRTIRLRGSAVSLSRQAHKAQRKLDQLRLARRTEAQPQPAASQPDAGQPEVNENVVRAFAKAERMAKQIIAKDGSGRWSKSYQKRERPERMADQMRKNQAAHLNATASGAALSPAA